MPEPAQQEIWLVRLDPVVGDEMRKTRPAIVVSADSETALSVRLVVPLTSWQERFTRHRSKVAVEPTSTIGLAARSVADVMHVRGLSVQRFERRLGAVEPESFDAIRTALILVTERRA